MSPEVASLVVAVVSLVVAVVATAAAIVAIRRDRADLRITAQAGAAGHHYLTIVNVGLRAVRVERLLVRRGRLSRWFGRLLRLDSASALSGTSERALPVVVQPASEAILHYSGHEYSEITDDPKAQMFIEDAAGRRYVVMGFATEWGFRLPPNDPYVGPTHWAAVGGEPEVPMPGPPDGDDPV